MDKEINSFRCKIYQYKIFTSVNKAMRIKTSFDILFTHGILSILLGVDLSEGIRE